MLKRFIISLAFCALAIFSIAQNSLNNQQVLVVATYQYGDNPRIQNIQPLASHITSVTDLQTEVKSYPTVHQLVQAMKNGEVDIAFMNTFGYLILREQTNTYEISAALQLPAKDASVYKSVIVTNKKNKITSLKTAVENAGDFMVAFVSPGSTSGNLLPRLKLASMMEVEPEMVFVEIQYAEQHNLALQAALNDEFMLAAFGSEEYYKLGADTVNLTKLWESPSIPLGPVVCKKELSESVKTAVQQILVALHEQNPTALDSVKAGWIEAKPADQFIVVDDTYYESMLNISGNRERSMKIIRRFAK